MITAGLFIPSVWGCMKSHSSQDSVHERQTGPKITKANKVCKQNLTCSHTHTPVLTHCQYTHTHTHKQCTQVFIDTHYTHCKKMCRTAMHNTTCLITLLQRCRYSCYRHRILPTNICESQKYNFCSCRLDQVKHWNINLSIRGKDF